MAGTKITGSANITLLDSRIFANVCDGQFIIDASPSVFLGSGADNVLGVKVQITNPYGVIIKPFGGTYDIPPPITGTYEHDMPVQAGKIQYGIYKIEIQLTDANGTTYLNTKNVNVCTYTNDNNPCDDRVLLTADCKNGTVTFQLAEPPPFKGKFAVSKVQSVRIDYPTASGLPPLETTVCNFSMQLFQGVYKATVSVCATYDMGDNIYLQLPYNVVEEKNVKCILDYTCIWPAFKRLNDKLAACTSEKDKQTNTLLILDALRLLTTAELANNAGADASVYIEELEEILGCDCSCDCSGSAIINNTPSTNIVIEGCNITKTSIGLTDVYNIDAKHYFLTVDEAQGILGISAVADYGCNIYQQLNFSVAGAYTAIKALINNTTEYNFWAAVINNTLNAIDATCLGFDTASWTALTFAQKITAIKTVACNGGAVCVATISAVGTVQSGQNVILTFTQTGGFSADIYVDGVLQGNVIQGVGTFTLEDFVDGVDHDFIIVPKCSNGSNGTAHNGTFGFIACPDVSPPSITDTNVNGVDCPYDLTTLVYPSPPLGVEVEWHNQNNTLASSLVADEENVSSGVFYAFAKNSDGCYSAGVQVTLVCNGATSCTAPQSLLVAVGVGGFKVSFQSASFPPPLNSYTVKRKAAADPDVDGSYTTIGTPVWNSSTNRWEITDATGVNNTLYTYKAISNCSATTPSVMYEFANITCPVVSLTPDTDSVDYSFTNVGGEVDKYVVGIYDSTGAVLISEQTIVPAFSTPITGTFMYLTDATTYKVKVKAFIGTHSQDCAFTSFITTGSAAVQGFVSVSVVATVTGMTVDGVAPAYVSGTDFPITTAEAGYFETEELGLTKTVAVAITGVFTVITLSDVYGTLHVLPFVGAGTYTFLNVPIIAGYSNWFIQVT